jgi:hypothetical protein
MSHKSNMSSDRCNFVHLRHPISSRSVMVDWYAPDGRTREQRTSVSPCKQCLLVVPDGRRTTSDSAMLRTDKTIVLPAHVEMESTAPCSFWRDCEYEIVPLLARSGFAGESKCHPVLLVGSDGNQGRMMHSVILIRSFGLHFPWANDLCGVRRRKSIHGCQEKWQTKQKLPSDFSILTHANLDSQLIRLT